MITCRTRHAVLSALVLSFSGAGSGHAQETIASATQALAAVYAQRDAASGHKDIAGATACFAPDFHFVDEKGRSEDAQHYRERVGGSLRDVKTFRSQTTIQSAITAPTSTVVTIHQHSEVAAEYRVLFIKRSAHVTVDDTKRDTWVKAGQAWQLKQTLILTHKQNIHP